MVPHCMNMSMAAPKLYVNWKAGERQIRTMGWFPESALRKSFLYQISTTARASGDLSLTSRLHAGILLATAQSKPWLINLVWVAGRLWPQLMLHLLATCSHVCSSLCYKSETIRFWNEECKEGCWEIVHLGKSLSRFVLSLLKPLLSSSSQILKTVFIIVFSY